MVNLSLHGRHICVAFAFLVCQEGWCATSISEIQDVWRTRKESIHSFEFECDVKRTEIIGGDVSDDPFAETGVEDEAGEPIVSKNRITFCKSGEKLSYLSSGEQWNDAKASLINSDFHVVFDGTDSQWLMGNGGTTHHASVSPGVKKPQSDITNGIYLAGLWIGFDPEMWLNNMGYKLGKMSASSEPVVLEDGTSCVELRIPRGEKGSSVILVDPARNYLPVKITDFREGILMQEFAVSYARDASVGWVVSSWNSSYCNDAGDLYLSFSGQVKQASINEPIDDSAFELSFPIGTRILEKQPDGVNVKYYMQESDGRRREISKEEFTKIQKPIVASNNPLTRLSSIITIVITAILAAAVVIKRKR